MFCEKIFGPTRDWECSCGKYKRVRFKGIICERCNVEVTRSKVRRERMGHIELAAPAVHIWYLRGTRSWLAYLLMGTQPKEELKAKQLEKVIYFGANLVISVDEDRRHDDKSELELEVRRELEAIEADGRLALTQRSEQLEAELAEAEAAEAKESELRALHRQADKDFEDISERFEAERERLERAWEVFSDLFSRQIIEDEELWRELFDRWGDYFEGGQGADAIARLIAALDFDAEEATLRNQINPPEGQRPLSAQRKQKAIKRLRILAAFNRRDNYGRRINDPRAMILDVVPVIPPELRPMVQLDGGRFATSDLNDLYRRVINRNNRLKRLLDLAAPDIIVNNEKRMLQEAVDALFDNGRRGRPVTGPGNRALKSLSDMLKGKQGRFRQNLLGKRVDYSGRSVIVAGPTLRFHQCGLPKIMALELFKPFVMKKLVDVELAPNIKSAKRMVERRRPQVWDVLEDVIREHPVLLNRAPTLHRLGIQAFEPVLVEGKAIQIHPLVCAAFNADFDGDQMAVHLPLSAEAQAEARVLMLSANNVLSPAPRPAAGDTHPGHDHRRALTSPRWWPVRPERGGPSAPSTRSASPTRTGTSRCMRLSSTAAPRTCWRLRPTATGPATSPRPRDGCSSTTPCPPVSAMSTRSSASAGWASSSTGWPAAFQVAEVAQSLDEIKDICFQYASRSGLTISIDDVRTPKQKTEILDRYEKQADKIERPVPAGDHHRRRAPAARGGGVVRGHRGSHRSDEGRTGVRRVQPGQHDGRVRRPGQHDADPPDRRHAGPGGQPPRRHDPPADQEQLPARACGCSSTSSPTPGARKGLVDTALRTADSGYLTRRLVDVAQEVIINSKDPFAAGTYVKGIWLEDVQPDSPHKRTYLETRLFGRVLAEDVALSDGSIILAGTMVGDAELAALRDDPEVTRVRVLSPLSDDSASGITGASYGMSLATGKLIEQGEAVGVIAAQSIGEPGTQLTMRTFHTGGVAGAQGHRGRPAQGGGALRGPHAQGQGDSGPSGRCSPHPRRGRRPHGGDRRERTAPSTTAGSGPSTASKSATATRWSPVTRWWRGHATRRSCWRSEASTPPSATWWPRSRRSTATRACRSTTSTSS